MRTIHTTSETSGQNGDRHEVSQNQRNSRAVPVLQMVDVRRYGRLLAKFTPKVIETEEESEQALAVVESLMARGDERLDLPGTLNERLYREEVEGWQ